MKSNHLSFLILPLAALCVVACTQPKTAFVLHGYVPGAMDSTQVELRSENGNRNIRLSGYIVNGEFELSGKAPTPVYCRLSMNNHDAAERRGIQEENAVKYVEANIFVENGNLVFRTPHIDSLPQSFWRYDIRHENNYTLKGSASHDVYSRYRRKTMDLQHRLRCELFADRDEHRAPDSKVIAALRGELREATRAFIASQRNLPVNLHLAQTLELEPFTYTQAQLDDMLELFAGYQDTCIHLQRLREDYRAASAHVLGTPFAGGRVFSPKGDTLDLKNLAVPGRYTLVDFWASWCGPCRASFPHLRTVHNTYGGRLSLLSVSVDKADKDWRKAMEEEKLPWAQYCATGKLSRALGKTYGITSIPTFLLIDPQGRIIFSGHDTNDLDVQLEKLYH